MKKLLIALMVLSFSVNVSGYTDYKPIKSRNAETGSVLAIHSQERSEGEGWINIQRKLKATYNMLNQNIDYILTVKGAVKTMFILTPFFMVYCRYFQTSLFDSDPIQALVNRIIQSIGKAEELYEIQREIGKSNAYWETLAKQPFDVLCVTAQKILDKTIYVGLPFMAGIFFKLGVGSK